MSAEIISKRCSGCKETKAISKFSKNRIKKDGHQSRCKKCCLQYAKSEKHKANQKHYEQSQKGRAARKHYEQGERRKVARKRHNQSDKRKATKKRYQQNHPERIKARTAVLIAIKNGQLPPIDSLQCSCGKPAKHYHHHKGYAKEHWLDVLPVCVKCHTPD